MIKRLLIAALALVTLQSESAAQDVQPGARVRVTTSIPAREVQTGTFQARTDTELVLNAKSVPVSVPLASITQLELSSGRKPSVVGGVVGLMLGVAAGAAVACDANRDSYGVFCGGQSDTKIAVGATIGGLAGASLGAFLFRRERWSPIELGRLSR
jgi:hypothetical protein